jgi:hypothetical protein
MTFCAGSDERLWRACPATAVPPRGISQTTDRRGTLSVLCRSGGRCGWLVACRLRRASPQENPTGGVSPSGTTKRTGSSMASDRSTAFAVWHGTAEELQRLSAAVEHNCSCVAGMFGRPREVCGAHRMLVDQRLLDHLLFVARTTDAFAQSEQRDDAGTADVPLGDSAALEPDITIGDVSGLASLTEGAGRASTWRPPVD